MDGWVDGGLVIDWWSVLACLVLSCHQAGGVGSVELGPVLVDLTDLSSVMAFARHAR